MLLLGLVSRGFTMDAFSTPVNLNRGSGLPMVFNGSVNYVRGISNEYVYDSDTGEKISQLDWEIEDVVMAGGVLSVWFSRKVQLNLGLWAAVTQGNGYMQDWDWDSSLGSGWSHWSRSPVDLEDAYILDLNIGYEFDLGRGISLTPLLGFKFDYWEWADHGGEYIYSRNGGWRNESGTFPDETGIRYEQRVYIPYLGMNLGVIRGRFFANAHVKGSLWAKTKAEDEHLKRSMVFNDRIVNQPFLGTGVALGWQVSQSWVIRMGYDFQKLYSTKGDSHGIDYSTGDTWFDVDAAGAAHESHSIYLSAGIGF